MFTRWYITGTSRYIVGTSAIMIHLRVKFFGFLYLDDHLLKALEGRGACHRCQSALPESRREEHGRARCVDCHRGPKSVTFQHQTVSDSIRHQLFNEMLIWFAFAVFFSDAQVIQWARPNHHIFKVASSAQISGSADRWDRLAGLHVSLRLGDSMQRQVRGHCDSAVILALFF